MNAHRNNSGSNPATSQANPDLSNNQQQYNIPAPTASPTPIHQQYLDQPLPNLNINSHLLNDLNYYKYQYNVVANQINHQNPQSNHNQQQFPRNPTNIPYAPKRGQQTWSNR